LLSKKHFTCFFVGMLHADKIVVDCWYLQLFYWERIFEFWGLKYVYFIVIGH
jgi:hypothetical protein